LGVVVVGGEALQVSLGQFAEVDRLSDRSESAWRKGPIGQSMLRTTVE
jgi:hypothetical protein